MIQNGDSIVISGIAGKYPCSNNVTEFAKNLFDKVDLVDDSETRWRHINPEIPRRTGKINHLEKFDAQFFNVGATEAHCMDPQMRMLLEHSYAAILDAGINPEALKGSRTGVFIGVCFSESEKQFVLEDCAPKGYGIKGTTRSMLANRLSYWLDFCGPSLAVDTACSSSMYAFDCAYNAIRSGRCDAALVGGTNLTLHPYLTLQFARLGVLSSDGFCRPFDKAASGYTRSDANAVVFLQRAKNAKRIYVHVLHSKTNCDGFKQEGITYPSGQIQRQLLDEFYEELGVSPSAVSYVEAHSTGTVVGDPEECDAIEKVFCSDRTDPMLIGSVKSNIGHTEASAGICSITKCIIASETGLIPPNIHFVSNRTDVPALMNAKLKVVSEATALNGSLLAINSFGFGGANAHALLQANTKTKADSPSDCTLPRLVTWSGRTQPAVETLFDEVAKQPLNDEFLALLHNIQIQPVPKFNYRGFRIFSISSGTLFKSSIVKVNRQPAIPTLLVLGGCDPHWKTKIDIFSEFPVFKKAVCQCSEVLKPKGVFLTENTASLLGTVVFQIGLVELLAVAEAIPDGFTGISIGQITCAYLDGAFSMDVAVLLGLYYSLLQAESNDTEKVKLKDLIRSILPRDIQPSDRWINGSTTQGFESFKLLNNNDTSIAEPAFSSDSVLLDTSELRPKEAVQQFLIVFGEFYQNGRQLNLANLYPPVEFPVSRGTPMISSLIQWDHSEDWYVIKFQAQRTTNSGIQVYHICLADQDNSYLAGHCIDGRVLFPATGYLQLVWECHAMRKGLVAQELAVEFNDVQFLRATTLTADQSVEFTVLIQEGTGQFEILDGSAAIVTGQVISLKQPEFLTIDVPASESTVLQQRDFYKELRLRGYHYSGEFRSVMKSRSDGSFAKLAWKKNWVGFLDCMLQSAIIACDSRSLMIPTGIENVRIDPITHLQLKLIDEDGQEFYNLLYNPHLNVLRSGGIQISGMQASTILRRPPTGIPVLESYRFVPYHPKFILPPSDAIRIFVQIILENAPSLNLHILECLKSEQQPIIQYIDNAVRDLPAVKSTLTVLSSTKPTVPDCVPVKNETLLNQKNASCIICSDQYQNHGFVSDALDALTTDGFLIVREQVNFRSLTMRDIKGLKLVSSIPTDAEVLLLFQKDNPTNELLIPIEVSSTDSTYSWLPQVQQCSNKKSVLLYSIDDNHSGILGLVNCLRREANTQQVRCCFIDDPSAPPFSADSPHYSEQLRLGLAINIYHEGQWGSYRHCVLPDNTVTKPVDHHCFANCLKPGDLSSFAWMNGPLSAKSKNLVNVVFSSLNFKDVMLATGKLSIGSSFCNRIERECFLGFEYSGVTPRGRRVMGMIPSGAMASQVASDPFMAFEVPTAWSLEQAATVPCVYGTVYTALFLNCSIQRGRSILIHAGSGGIGLAAIETCLAYGVKVFTTVSTREKREFLLARFPSLKVEHIGNSRDISFERMIKVQTKGRGVDYVLNSLAEEKLQASVRCLRTGGHFLEIGKYDMTKNSKLALELFQRGITFTAVLLDLLFQGTVEQKQRLHRILTEDIERGVIKPLPTTVFKATEVEKAFRYLAGGKHMGKVLLKMRLSETDECMVPLPVTPRIHCDPDRSYVLVGGLGGFGLELADWLVLRGCRKLVMSSSRGVSQPYQEYRIRIWQSYGVQVVVSTEDITTERGCQQLIVQASTLGPVAAIFNLAVQLRDSIFDNQSAAAFAECLAPKASATIWLDRISRTQCPELQHFVVFSSVSCGRGNAGQSNYGMANSVMERVVERRRTEGLPGKAIQWGAIGDVGLVANLAEGKQDLEIGGTLQQRMESCLQVLDRLLTCDEPVVASMVVAEKNFGAGNFRNIVEAVMNIMNIRDIKAISLESTLADIGMDSLMAVEIKQVLERDFDLTLSAQELRNLTFSKLQQLMVSSENAEREEPGSQSENINIDGLEMLVRNLGSEATSQHTILRLQSLSNDLDYDKAVLIIPGIESVAGEVWTSIAAKLNAPTFILQTLNYYQCRSLPEIVDSIFDEIRDKVFKNVDQFIIVGYSFGSIVGIEIAKRLQEHLPKGALFLIDGSPKYVQLLASPAVQSCKSDDELQTILILAIVSKLFPNKNLTNFTITGQSFTEKIAYLQALDKDEKLYSKQYVEQMLISLFHRLKMANSIDPKDYTNVLHCPIVLLKPEQPVIANIEDDYGLSRVTDSIVVTKTTDGTHASMLTDTNLSDYINKEFL